MRDIDVCFDAELYLIALQDKCTNICLLNAVYLSRNELFCLESNYIYRQYQEYDIYKNIVIR